MSHLLPAQAIDKFNEHPLKGDAVQRITGLGLAHCGVSRGGGGRHRAIVIDSPGAPRSTARR